MNEEAVRQVLLVQAIETEDREQVVLSADDRHYASHSARELARWQAANAGQAADFGQFLQQRAALLLQRLAERHAGFARLARAHMPWQALTVLPLAVALLLGFGLDRWGDPHRVDLLSLPLLAIIAWNLLVYASTLVWYGVHRLRAMAAGRLPARSRGVLPPAWQSGLPRLARLPRKWPAPLLAAAPRFAEQWAQLSAPLSQQRAARIWHLAAAGFALGAAGSLYLRGMLVEYRTGWESTFLGPQEVHAALGLLFAPALALLPLQGFSLQDVEALRWAAGTTTAPHAAAGGARWVHLYAATLGLFVVVPRLLLAGWAHLRVRQLAHHMAPDLGQAYFLQLRRAAGAGGGTLRVVPYSLRVDDARERGLNQVALQLLGDDAHVALRPAMAYGDAPESTVGELAASATPTSPADALGGTTAGTTLAAVLFSLAATPEKENHGALLAALQRSLPQGFLVLVDESALRERLGAEAAGTARLAERVALWESFCRFHRCEAILVNLLDPAARPLQSRDAPAPAPSPSLPA